MAEQGPSYETISKLTSSNYTAWKRDIEILLQHYGSWEFITGTEKPPAADASDRVKESYDRRRTRAWTTIALSVDETIRPILDGITDGKEAWQKLKTLYEPKSFARTAALLGDFDSLRFLEGEESIGIFLARIRRKTKELADMDYAVNVNYEAYSALRYLPEEYDGLVRELYSLESSDFTLDNIESKLIAEEGRLMQKRKDLDLKHETYNTHKFKQRCSQIKGDTKKEGMKSKQEGPRTRNKREIVCFRCNKQGHIARECRTPDKRNRKEPRSSNFIVSSMLAGAASNNTWILDTGATDHFCSDLSLFKTFKNVEKSVHIASNENTLSVKGIGKVELKIEDNLGTAMIGLENTLYAPDIRRNIISGSKLDDANHTFSCKEGSINIFTPDRRFLFSAKRVDGLYEVPLMKKQSCNLTKTTVDIETWHRRLGHANYRCLEEMAKQQTVRNMQLHGHAPSSCEPCMVSKATRTSFKNAQKTTVAVCEKIHMDLWGKSENRSITGAWYFLSCLDDFSRRAFIYPIAQKSDTVRVFEIFKAYIENQTGKKIKCIRTDNGLEFCNEQMSTILRKHGIRHEKTSVETPEENGIAERYNRTIVEGVRTVLSDTGLPKYLWSELVTAACYLRNRTGHATLHGKTPMEMWNGTKPSVAHLKTLGCTAYVLRPKQGRRKLDPKAKKGYMVGYKYGMRGYRIWIPETNQVISSVHVRFDEQSLYKPLCNINDNTKTKSKTNVHKRAKDTYVNDVSSEDDRNDSSHTDEESSDTDQSTRDEKPDETVTTRQLRPRMPTKTEGPTTGSKSIDWIRKVKPRHKSTRVDVFYYPKDAPSTRLRSLNDVRRYCEKENIAFKEEEFDFKDKQIPVASNDEESESDYQDSMA